MLGRKVCTTTPNSRLSAFGKNEGTSLKKISRNKGDTRFSGINKVYIFCSTYEEIRKVIFWSAPFYSSHTTKLHRSARRDDCITCLEGYLGFITPRAESPSSITYKTSLWCSTVLGRAHLLKALLGGSSRGITVLLRHSQRGQRNSPFSTS